MTSKTTMKDLLAAMTSQLSGEDVAASLVTSKAAYMITNSRVSLGQTQKEFADYMGVSQSMVSKWETGDYNFSLETLSKVFYKLGISIDFHKNEASTRATKTYSSNISTITFSPDWEKLGAVC